MNTHLSLEIAVAVIGVRVGLMDGAANVTVILFAVLTVLLMPMLFSAILPHKEPEVIRFKLIAGVNETSLKVAQELRLHGDAVRVIPGDSSDEVAIKKAGFPLMDGAGNIVDLIESLDVNQVEAFLALHEDCRENLELCRLARQKEIRNIVAYVVEPALLPEFNRLKVQAYTPAIQRIALISMMARSPDALNLLASHQDDNDTIEITLRNGMIHNRQLRFLGLPGDCLVLAVRRGGELIVPRGNTDLKLGDRLTLFGAQENLLIVRRWLEEGNAPRPDFVSNDYAASS